MSDKHSQDRPGRPRVPSLRPECWSVGAKLVVLTLPFIAAMVAVAVWAVHTRTTANLEEKLIQRARSLHTQITADRHYYASVIVPRVVELGGTIGEDYQQVHGRFPLPATFVREVSELTANVKEGYTASLLSPWAINPGKGLKDQFQRNAFARLMEHPTGQFIQADTQEGLMVMRVLMGDLATTQSCVDCHNAHPKSPRHDFKLGDLMGGLEITVPLETYHNERRQDMALMAAGGTGLTLLVVGMLVLGSRWTVSRPLGKLTENMLAFIRSNEGRAAQADAVPTGDEVRRLEKVFGGLMQVIQRDELKFHRVVQAAPNAILLVNQQGTITLVNLQAEKLFGYAREDLLGQPIEILVPARFRGAHPGHRAAFVADPKARAMGASRDLYGLHKDGRETPIEISLNPIQTGEGTLVLTSIIDITERKQNEKKMLEAQQAADRANQAKSEFLSRMSHELRTPLNAVLGFAQLLELDTLSPEQQQHTQHILKGGRHLLALINEVLDIARIEAGRMTFSLEPVSVSAVINEAVDLVRPQAAARHIQLITPAAREEIGYVRADRQRLKQVLLNLLSNGVKYNKDGGTLTVTCQTVPEGRYRMTITDTGGGIPPALLSRLFTPFDRLDTDSRTEGTGLGLVLSRGLITVMGGTVSVDSVVGQGTSVAVELASSAPPVPCAATVSHKVQVTASASGGDFTVLYIEDNLANYQLVEHLLERRPDVRLLSAMQGKLGVELAASHRPDLILLDLNLPDIQGDEVLLRLRERPETAGIPVIMLSADAMQRQIDKLLAAGARGYLTKPIEVAQFYALLDELVATKGGKKT